MQKDAFRRCCSQLTTVNILFPFISCFSIACVWKVVSGPDESQISLWKLPLRVYTTIISTTVSGKTSWMMEEWLKILLPNLRIERVHRTIKRHHLHYIRIRNKVQLRFIVCLCLCVCVQRMCEDDFIWITQETPESGWRGKKSLV